MFRKLPTLKSLPSAIGLPFLSTQEDAQLKFRSGEGGIKRLYGDEVGSRIISFQGGCRGWEGFTG
jgi:hypothetical protein